MSTTFTRSLAFGLLITTGSLLAQEPRPQTSAPTGGWRKIGEAPPPAQGPAVDPGYQAERSARYQDERNPDYQPQRNPPPPPPPSYQRDGARDADYQRERPQTIPPQLTIRPGTYITVRINQGLSSDHNQPGDAFSATLVRPVVVDGVVVAARGEMVNGRVAEARKAGRTEGVSRLALQLTDMTIVDGQQIPIQCQVVGRTGDTSVGRDAAAIGGTTALGAAIGASARGGEGAAIGAGAGALIGIIGVLTTRGHATVIYPEQVLTFRIEAPVVISTERAAYAFRYVDPSDYERAADRQPRMMERRPVAPPPYYYGGPGYYPYSPYYWGPGFSFYYGSYGYGGRRGFYGGGRFRR